MTDDRNTLEWPSINQFHREVCSRIKRFLTVAEAAATVIQRAHRHQARGERSDFHGGFRSSLHTWLLRSAVTTSEKLDGTNVGKLDDGTLLGRRMVIEWAMWARTLLGQNVVWQMEVVRELNRVRTRRRTV